MFEEEFEPNIAYMDMLEVRADAYEEIRRLDLSEGYIREKREG